MRLSSLALLLAGACTSPTTPDSGDVPTPGLDADADGYTADEDCDDDDPAVHPDADERCGGGDEDCDGQIDDDDDSLVGDLTVWVDADADGHGDAASPRSACAAGDGESTVDDDCDDTRDDVSPDAPELCDRVDNDCDGTVDGDAAIDAAAWYPDGDGDGYGIDGTPTTACRAPDGYAAGTGDCDDDASTVHPGATEVCGDGLDNDCDGSGNGCVLGGTVDFAASPPGTVLLDDATTGGFRGGRAIGDVDGDGLPDLILAPGSGDVAWIVRGTPEGEVRSADAWTHLTPGSRDSNYATNALGGFDWDDDGLADVVVPSTQYARDDLGYLRVFTGLRAGELTGDDSDQKLEYSNGEYVGAYALASGDLDGDGEGSDLLARTASTSPAGVSWLAGWARGSDELIVNLAVETGAYNVGGAALADLDGDGIEDLAFGAPNVDRDAVATDAGVVFVGLGPVADLADLDDGYDALHTGFRDGDRAGTTVQLGDADADGHADLLVGAPVRSSGADVAAYLVLDPLTSGSLSGADATWSSGLEGEGVRMVGDVDGDGGRDVVVTDPYDWTAWLYWGSTPGAQLTSTAAVTFTGDRSSAVTVEDPGDLDGDGHAELALSGLTWWSGSTPYSATVLVDGSGL